MVTDNKLYKVAITVDGNYVHGKYYDTLTQVYYAEEDGGDGCSYISVKPNQNVVPGTDDTVWKRSSRSGKGEKGDTGERGPQGPQGEKGDPGEIDEQQLQEIESQIAAKQDALVSGTNIKTVGGQSILGGGNIQVGDENAVRFTEQSLTTEQKAQARTNIGAGTSSFSGNYNDLSNKPTIPAAQVNADWDSSSGVSQILNKPTIPTVPVISTDISADATSDTKTASPKAVKDYVDAHTDPNAVKFTEQSLTSSQKEQARINIGAVSADEYENPFKGMYASLALLETAYPNPLSGDYAYVKNSGTTANIYSVVGGEWTDSGVPVEVTDVESSFTRTAKILLLQTLGKVAWIDQHGEAYLETLKNALLANIIVNSVSAVYSGGDVSERTSLDNIKPFLTVTATYSDGSLEIVDAENYSLSGTIAIGSNTITVTYMGATTTFSITAVKDYAGSLSNWTLHPSNSVATYTNGYIQMKATNSTDFEGWGVWCIDNKKTSWATVNGKTLKFRFKTNDISLGSFGIGVYKNNSITSLADANVKRVGMPSPTLAEDGYYESIFVCDINNFAAGGLVPDSNAMFGILCYCRTQNTFLEIYDAQVIEVI